VYDAALSSAIENLHLHKLGIPELLLW